MNRRLTLKSEHLSELTTGELAAVAGASVVILTLQRPCPSVQECIASIPSLQRACPTDYCTGTTTTA